MLDDRLDIPSHIRGLHSVLIENYRRNRGTAPDRCTHGVQLCPSDKNQTARYCSMCIPILGQETGSIGKTARYRAAEIAQEIDEPDLEFVPSPPATDEEEESEAGLDSEEESEAGLGEEELNS